jgi:hypothetical protein
MKAIELPINALVIIVIVLVVLLAVISLFFGVWTPTGSLTTLESATQSTCMKVNPMFCKGSYPNFPDDFFEHSNMYAARMPVYNFDADKDGEINEHHSNDDGPFATCGHTTCTHGGTDDNLEELCYYYHGCNVDLQNDNAWLDWYKCCLKKVCGCP